MVRGILIDGFGYVWGSGMIVTVQYMLIRHSQDERVFITDVRI